MTSSTNRVVNFNPGPAALPLEALERAARELVNFEGSGMSILEHSHRGPVYERVHDEALSLLRELLNVPSGYRILLLQGGAHQQFAMVPMNLRTDAHVGDYVITGAWARKAFAEARRVGTAAVAADVEKDGRFLRIPRQEELRLSANAAYVHVTSNNTLYGTQYRDFPETGATPLIADMSSDLLSRAIDVSRFGLIYAAAQKNLGPAGVTVVIIREDLLARSRTDIPEIFQYGVHARENSLYNTAPTFSIYMMRNVLSWLKQLGGVSYAQAQAEAKASLLYALIDRHPDFFRSEVEPAARSQMNLVFHLPSPELDRRFVEQAAAQRLVGLKGHRLAGGIRVSLYNPVSVEDVSRLVEFMHAFRAQSS
ncbi:MAG TPA: 3-phosphoserine/phosphohydroxythreonine transaminase [Polyangiales bacterium]|nr:3-phosphoserine/phosphohydroxythreonine transaminase [Polyangiales bacterium]